MKYIVGCYITAWMAIIVSAMAMPRVWYGYFMYGIVVACSLSLIIAGSLADNKK